MLRRRLTFLVAKCALLLAGAGGCNALVGTEDITYTETPPKIDSTNPPGPSNPSGVIDGGGKQNPNPPIDASTPRGDGSVEERGDAAIDIDDGGVSGQDASASSD
jgi:hypothetical protein